MADNDEIVNLIIDAKNLSSDELNQVSKEVEDLGKVAEKAEKQLQQLKIEQSAIQSFSQLQSEVKQLKTNLAAAEVEYEKSTKALKENKNATDEERAAVKAQNIELKQSRTELNKRNNELVKATATLKNLSISQRSAATAESDYAAKIKATQAAIKTAQNNYKTEAATLKEIYLEKKKLIERANEEKIAVQETAAINERIAKERTAQLNKETELLKKKRAEQAKQAKSESDLVKERSRVTTGIKTYEAELSKLHEELKKGTITKGDYIRSEAALRSQLKLTEGQVKASNAALIADNQIEKKTRSTDLLTKATRRVAQAYTAWIFAQKATSAITEAVKGHGELEAAQIKVQKTTDLAREQLLLMTDELRALATEVTPTATTELLHYAEVAGQLGVEGSDSILQMVAAADALNVSTDLAGDEAATLLTRILTMTKEGVPSIDNLASAVVELGNTTATTESEIVNMTKEIVTGTTAIGLGSTVAAAYGATLKELGQTGERSRSAFTRLSSTIQNAVLNGGAELEQLSLITGQTAADLKKNLGDAPEKILNDFIAGLAKVRENGGTTQNTLEQFGITAGESIQVFDALANNVDRLARNVENADRASVLANAHIVEASKAYASQDSTVKRLINTFTSLEQKVGQAYSDETDEALRNFTKLIDENAEAVTVMMEYLVDLGGELVEMAVALGEVSSSLINLGGDFDLIKGAVDGFRVGMNLITGTIQLAAAGLLEFRIQYFEFINFFSTSGRQFDKNIENLRKSQDKLFKGADEDFADAGNAIQDFNGTSSDAFRDLLVNAEKYSGAVRRLSDDQRKQLSELTSGTVKFNAEQSDSYRRLTANIIANQREIEIETKLTVAAAERKRKSLQEQSEGMLRVQRVVEEVSGSEKTLSDIRVEADKAFQDGLTTLDEYKTKLSDVDKAEQQLADSAKAAKLSIENNAGTFSKSSEEVINLKDKIAKLDKQLALAKTAMNESSKGLVNYEQGARDAATATRELTKANADLAFQQQLESANKFKAAALNRENELAIQRLQAAYDSGRLSVTEFNTQMDVLRGKQSALKGSVDESTTSTTTNTVVVKENTVAAKENAVAKEELADAEEKGMLAASAHVAQQLALREQYDFTAKTIEELTQQYDNMDKGVRRLSVFASSEWFGDLINITNAASMHKRETVAQTIAMKRLLAEVEGGSLTLAQLANATDRAQVGFGKLGDEQLEPLNRAIEQARREFERLDASINSSLEQTQDRLDRLLGKEGDILARRFKGEIQDAQKLLDSAVANGDANAIRAARENITKLEKIHSIETKNFRDEKTQADKDKKEAKRQELQRIAEEKAKLEQVESEVDAVTVQPLTDGRLADFTSAEQAAPQIIQVNLTFGNTGTTKTVRVFGQESADNLISALTDAANNNLTGVN